MLVSAAADTPRPPPGGPAGPVPAQPGAAGVGGDAAEDSADRSAAVAGWGRGRERSWPRLVSLTWPWVPVAWRAPPGEALKVPAGHLRQTFWLPSLQSLITGGEDSGEAQDTGCPRGVGAVREMKGLPSPPPTPLPLLLRSRSHVVLSPSVGAQVLGAGAEGPRGLAQVPAGELGTGTGGG